MPEPLLRVENLKKHFPVTKGLLMKTIGWIKAVDGVSFDIHPGETLALVGESGCGKTTTARVILQLLPATAGSVWFEGKDIFSLLRDGVCIKEFRSSVQSVFQDPFSSLNPRMRVESIVAEPLVVNKKVSDKAMKERVEEVLLQVGLAPEDARKYPHEFSGGQRQRIAIARSLVVSPKLIILDEPVSGLDVSIRAQIMNLVKDLQQQLGVSYLLIAHDLATVRYMSQRIAVMYAGKLVELAPTEELFTHLYHPYTQALVSAALPAHPDVQRQEVVLHGEVPNPINFPPGCRFHPRCRRAQKVCSTEEPPLKEIKSGHWLACHLEHDSVT